MSSRKRRLCSRSPHGSLESQAACLAVLLLGAAAVQAQVAPNAAVAGLTPKFVDVAGVATRYYEYGEGEPVVLVHGGGRGTTSSANNFSPVIPLLAERFHVYAVDKSAAGMTGNPLDDADLGPRGEVEHMYQFLRTMGLDQAHLVGHSSGGALTFYLAVEHPEVVKTLTVVAHGPGMPPAGEGPTRHDLAEEAQCAAPQTTYEGRRCRLELLAHQPETFDEEFILADGWMADQPKSQEARAKYAAMDPAARRASYVAYRQEMWDRARAGAVTVPTLIYAAKQDTLSWDADDPHAMMRGELDFFDILGASNPRVQMILINEAGHFPYREHPQQFAADLAHFIEFWNEAR